MLKSIQILAENSANNQSHLLRWFMFFLVNTEEPLSVSERDAMLCTYQSLVNAIDLAKKEVCHV